MTPETKEALKIVIAYMDELMTKNPSRELADCCNLLQQMLDEE